MYYACRWNVAFHFSQAIGMKEREHLVVLRGGRMNLPVAEMIDSSLCKISLQSDRILSRKFIDSLRRRSLRSRRQEELQRCWDPRITTDEIFFAHFPIEQNQQLLSQEIMKHSAPRWNEGWHYTPWSYLALKGMVSTDEETTW